MSDSADGMTGTRCPPLPLPPPPAPRQPIIRQQPPRPHLDVDQQLPQAPGGHHRGGVELADVALVQSDVVIGRETLEELLVLNDFKGVIQA